MHLCRFSDSQGVARLGLVRTSLLFGMLNAGVALWATWLLLPLVYAVVAAMPTGRTYMPEGQGRVAPEYDR